MVDPADAGAFLGDRPRGARDRRRAEQILFQLLTKYADVPLAFFVGLGLAAGAAWVVGRRDDPWLLGCFALFLGLAGITKNEGLLYALAGAVALAVPTIMGSATARGSGTRGSQ